MALKSLHTDDGFNSPIRSLSRLFREKTSNNHGDFTVWVVCIHFKQITHVKKNVRLCGNNYYCHVEMPAENDNTLKYNHSEKSLKVPFTIYADLECLSIKEQSCQNNPNDSCTERKAMHESCSYSLDLVSSFDFS